MPTATVEQAVEWHAAHIRSRQKQREMGVAVPAAAPTSGGAEPSIRTWYDRRQKALALHAERMLALAEGRSIDAAAAKERWTGYITRARARLLAIPSKIAPQLPDAQRVKVFALLTRELHDALRELAGQKGNGHDDGT